MDGTIGVAEMLSIGKLQLSEASPNGEALALGARDGGFDSRASD